MPVNNSDNDVMQTVLIVGCGNIAGGFDGDGGDVALTHAGAYCKHGSFRLAGCVDPDADRRGAFQQRWAVEHAYASLPEALESGIRFDVISICSPTPQHANDLRMVLRKPPRLVFCEKPLATGIEEVSALVAACRDSRTLLAVNYTRRWDPEVSTFKIQLERGAWGQVRSAVGYYNKGVLNNGSHMVDLLQHLLGPLKLLAIGEAQFDHSSDDPTVPAFLATATDTPVFLATGTANDFALFELQIVTENGVISIEQGGFRWRERLVRDSPHFLGYRDIGEAIERKGGYTEAMHGAVTNIYDALTKGSELASTGDTALAAQALCEQIRQRGLASRRN